MKIDCSDIPASHNIEEIRALIKNEISDGKLKQFKIESVQMQLPIKENEYQGIIWLEGESGHPKMFTILAYDKNPKNWLLKLPTIQVNR